MTERMKFWLGLLVFAAVYLSLRVFWLDGDPGIPTVWEYGYNATDEGYYLAGGKEKWLWGRFVDLPRMEAFTYGFSAGTHGLSYLAHLLFGLSTWTWRIPFFVLTCVAWLCTYAYVAKRAGVWTAVLLCLAFSSTPLTVAYERTASNDVLIGSLTVIAYVLAAGKARWRLVAAAGTASLIVLVKPSVWVLLPIVLAGVLVERKFRRAWLDVAVFLGVAVAAMAVWRLLAAWAVLPDARAAGVSVWEVIRRTTTHYALPSVFDFASHFRGLSAFPRDPSYTLLGVSTVFVFVLPVTLLAWNVVHRRWNGHTLLFAAVPAYIAAVNVMNTQYTHYFIPALMMLPILVAVAQEELAAAADGPAVRVDVGRVVKVLALTGAVCAVALLFLLGVRGNPKVLQTFYSNVYNFPNRNVWGCVWVYMAVFTGGVVAVVAGLRGPARSGRMLPLWGLAALSAASVVFAAFPAVQLASYLHRPVNWYFAPLALMLVVSAVLLVAVFGLSDAIRWRKVLAPFAFLSVLVCFAVTPNWRQAACAFVKPATHHHAEAAKVLRELLPDDAIVIGERSNQMLMSLPIRTATTFAANSDPIPVIESIRAVEPQTPLYALVDSRHTYNLQHYREHAKEYALRPMKTFRMPSFETGRLADVSLCRIEVVKQVGLQNAPGDARVRRRDGNE